MDNKYSLVKELTVVILLVSIFYIFQLGTRPLNNPDEGRYSSVAYEMIQNKNYVTPTIMGSTFFDKPPMHYWLQVSAFKMFGINSWSIRFWPTLLGIISIIFTYIVARIIFNTKVAICATSILATSPLFYFASKYANTDLEIASFVTLTLFSFLLGYRLNNYKYGKLFYFLAYILAGLGFLTKGLIALVFPTVIIGLWIILLKKWKLLIEMKPWWGILIVGIIISPWLYLVSKANPCFLHYFFVYQQFSRFLSIDKFNNVMPIWFYIVIIIAGFWGWSLLFIACFKKLYNDIKKKNTNYEYLVFFIIWILFILLFFSIPKTKLVGYILPTFPAIAIMLGYTCYSFYSKITPVIKFIAIFQYTIFVAFIVALFFIVKNTNLWINNNNLYYSYIFIPFILVFAIPLFYLWNKKATFVSFFIFITYISSVLLLITNNSSKYIYTKPPSTKPLYEALKPHLSDNTKIIVFKSYLPDITLYVKTHVYYANQWENIFSQPYEDSDESRIAKYCYANNFDKCPFLLNYSTLKKMWHTESKLFVIVKNNNLDNFKNIIGVYKIVSRTPGLSLITNKL